MTPEQIEKERKLFESYYSDNGRYPSDIAKSPYGDDEYLYTRTESAWDSWLERAELAAQQADPARELSDEEIDKLAYQIVGVPSLKDAAELELFNLRSFARAVMALAAAPKPASGGGNC